MPEELLKLSRDLALIDDYEFRGDKIWIRQGIRTRYYSPEAAQAMLDAMLEHAPTLRKITAGCRRFHRDART
jgi:hypothetical protein